MHASLNFHGATFMTSASTLGECPADDGIEIAICGRSNAGKSSAINYLTGNARLARTSKTPGRTRLLNFFALDPDAELRLVDLPGYGYAKVPEAVKDKWHEQIDAYLRQRRSLAGIILVMDIRHPLREFDRMMIEWAGRSGVHLHILLSKCDKLKRGARKKALLEVRRALPDTATVQLFSSTSPEGRDEVIETVESWLAVPD